MSSRDLVKFDKVTHRIGGLETAGQSKRRSLYPLHTA